VDGVAPDLGVDDPLRHLALAEAGDLHLVRDAAIGAVEVLGILVYRDLDGELYGVLRGVLDSGFHVGPGYPRSDANSLFDGGFGAGLLR